MATPRFAVYYADGSVVEGGGPDDELVEVTIRVSRDWLAAPADRVLGVVVEKDPAIRAHVNDTRSVLRGVEKDNAENLYGVEWYYPTEGGEYGFADDLGAWLRKLGHVVKRGEYVSNARMTEFWQWVKGWKF